jgi:hypothetical protein
MPAIDPIALCTTIILDSTCELLAHYGATVERAETGKTADLAAFIGFGVSGYRGSLSVSIPRDTLELTRPRGVEIDPADWLAELCNQLIGRVKARLLLHGPEPIIGLPTVVSGKDLELRKSPGRTHRNYWFRDGDRPILVMLEVDFEPKFEFHEAVEPEVVEDMMLL